MTAIVRDCRFCLELQGETVASDFAAYAGKEFGSRVRIVGKGFVALAVLGPVQRGHVLLIPQRHVISFGQLGELTLRDADFVLRALRGGMARVYRCPTVAFEHGATSSDCRLGACVDHAHIHVLPANIDMTEALTRRYGPPLSADVTDLARWAQHGYLLFSDTSGVVKIWQPDLVPSQLLRSLAWQLTHGTEVVDWRDDPNLGSVRQTLDDLEPVLESIGPL